jgi:flagellar biosynthetic protein FliQ
MTGAEALDLARDSIWVLILVSAPVMLVALAVGTGIGILQALTQVQEATIVFVPKIITVFLVLLLLLPFMSQQLGNYTTEIFARMATP